MSLEIEYKQSFTPSASSLNDLERGDIFYFDASDQRRDGSPCQYLSKYCRAKDQKPAHHFVRLGPARIDSFVDNHDVLIAKAKLIVTPIEELQPVRTL